MDAEHLVTTAGGKVRGKTSARSRGGKVSVYRGIPYAAAPFGEYRFRAPAPVDPWEGVRECIAFGPPAPQGGQLIGAAPWNATTSLDCLRLNVWTAAKEGDHAPVLVWIHGGAYIVGSSAEATYDGTRLAETGLVVVSINHRLGFEGFGHVPGRPENRGLLDQAAALRWVRDNIAAFGGDPDNVTVAGESAGAGAVAGLLVSPQARGLFRRAIAHSIPADMLGIGTARRISERHAEILGVPLEADALAAQAPEKILAATDEILSQTPTTGVRTKSLTCFAPVVGDESLPETPLRAAARGATAKVDLLVGHNLHEYRLFTEMGQSVEIDDEEALQTTASRAGLGTGALATYRELHPDASLQDLYTAIMGDAMFNEFTVRLAETHAKGGGRAHVFRLAAESPALGGRLGACHAFDLPFSFGNLDTDFAAFLLDGTPNNIHTALSDRMVTAWHDFAATGDPGWPAVTTEATPVKVWNEIDELHATDRTPVRRLWREVPFSPR